MDFNDTPEEAAFRAEARAFLDANAEPQEQRAAGAAAGRHRRRWRCTRCKAWQAKKADAGFAGITWPKRFGGREASPILQVIYKQEEDELRRAARPVRDRPRHVHPDHDGLREAGTTRPLRAAGAARRGSLVPVVLRTGRRLGPRGAAHAGGARRR